MNRKQKIIVSITGIILVSLILIGLTYAYFLTKITGNTNTKSISVSTANLVLEYGENTNVVKGINNAEPGYSVEKIFTATNKGNSDVTYGAALENIVNELSRQEDLVYTLTCTSYLKEGFSLASDGTITGTVDWTCNGTTEKQFPSTSTLSVMITNTIDITHTQAYKLTITYKEMNVDQSDDMNKAFSAKVNIVDLRANADKINPYSSNKNALNYQIINNALNGGINKTTYGSEVTTFTSISGENERVLNTAPDDYGTSYYFRGNVLDNYVSFADMCWRIVRIEGDGSIKLILASELSCSDTNVTTSSGYAIDGAVGVQGTKLTATYGYKNVGSYNVDDYINSTANTTKNARTKLNEWLERKITNQNVLNLLKNENWCIGDRTNAYIYNRTTKTYELSSTTAEALISAEKQFYYSVRKRIYETKTPTLKCDGSKDGEIDTNKVGMLTADEIAFAGGTTLSNSSYYLNKNATSGWWWTISPSSFIGDSSEGGAFYVMSDGSVSGMGVSSGNNFRPTVTLNSITVISGGNGTISEPYAMLTNWHFFKKYWKYGFEWEKTGVLNYSFLNIK